MEQQLQALATALAHGSGAQAATLRHLELFEAAVQGLKVRFWMGSVTEARLRAAGTENSMPNPLSPPPSATHRAQESAGEAAARRDELLLAAKRLALELRGLDLLAGHVQVGQGGGKGRVVAADTLACVQAITCKPMLGWLCPALLQQPSLSYACPVAVGERAGAKAGGAGSRGHSLRRPRQRPQRTVVRLAGASAVPGVANDDLQFVTSLLL